MGKVLWIILWLSLSGCVMHNASVPKSVIIQQKISDSHFHCNLGMQTTDIHLKSDSTFVYKKGPFWSYGKWWVSSDAKFLHLKSDVKRISVDVRLVDIYYRFKIVNQ